MIEIRDFQIKCAYMVDGKVYITDDTFWQFHEMGSLDDVEPVPITKEILKNNLGFTIHDMGDFWQCELEQFVLIQPKLHGMEMPFVFGYKTLVPKSVVFTAVHDLQNFYYQIERKELLWKNTK